MKLGETPILVSIIDLDGSAFPHPTTICSQKQWETDWRLGCRFIHKVAQASYLAQIYTSRTPVKDTPPPFISHKMWKRISSHFPFISPWYMQRLSYLGRLEFDDINMMRSSNLGVRGGKIFDNPIENMKELIKGLNRRPDIVYYFGDAEIDKRYSEAMRKIEGCHIKFINMGIPITGLPQRRF